METLRLSTSSVTALALEPTAFTFGLGGDLKTRPPRRLGESTRSPTIHGPAMINQMNSLPVVMVLRVVLNRI